MLKNHGNSALHAILLSIIAGLTAALFVLDARLRRAQRLFRALTRYGGRDVE